MFRRITTTLLGVTALAGMLAFPSAVSACKDRHHSKCGRGYSSAGYRSYYSDDYYRPRYRYVKRTYVVYEPVYDYGYSSYGSGYGYGYDAYRYGCGDCGSRFGSSHWLKYHRRHTDCD